MGFWTSRLKLNEEFAAAEVDGATITDCELGSIAEVDGAESWDWMLPEDGLSPSSSNDDVRGTFCWWGDRRSLFLGGGDVAPPEPESDSVEEASVRNRTVGTRVVTNLLMGEFDGRIGKSRKNWWNKKKEKKSKV